MEFDIYLKKLRITRRLTVPYCPEQNGVAVLRTLVEMSRCLLIQSGLTPKFWTEAINTANYIRNCCHSKSLNEKTPFKLKTGIKPDV